MTQKYACLVKRKDKGSWSWSGYAVGLTPLGAAAHLAISVKGYDKGELEEGWKREIVEQFIEDGWRFKLIEVKTDSKNMPVEHDNTEIG